MQYICRRAYSPVLKKAVEEYLQAKGLEYTLNERDGSFKFSRDTGTELGVLDYRILVYKEGVMIYEILPFREEIYTRKEREELINFIISASYGDPGCWTMDIRGDYGGEIAYRIYCDWGKEVPDERWTSWLDRYFERVLLPMHNFLHGFEDIIYNGTTSRWAIHLCIINILPEGMGNQ